jgi:hypothetical protein
MPSHHRRQVTTDAKSPLPKKECQITKAKDRMVAQDALCAGQNSGVGVLSARLFRRRPPQWRLNPMAKKIQIAKNI